MFRLPMNNLKSLYLETARVFITFFMACRLSPFWTSNNNYCYICNLIFISGAGKFDFSFPV